MSISYFYSYTPLVEENLLSTFKETFSYIFIKMGFHSSILLFLESSTGSTISYDHNGKITKMEKSARFEIYLVLILI